MTVKEAKQLLQSAPNDSTRCRINPSLTTADFYKIMMDCMDGHEEDHVLHYILEKRVYQCVKNQKRPKY